MDDKFKETLKKIEEGISKGNIPTSSSTEFSPEKTAYLAGDPNCPHCGGLGYLRSDFPVGHPEFGRLQICVCRRAEVSQRTRHKLYAASQLAELKHLTFENFEPRGRGGNNQNQANSIEVAFQTTQQFAQELKGWLFLQGGFGCGKTHLAAAVANFVVDHGVKTIFLTVPDLLDTLRYTYQDPEETFESRFEEIRGVRLLILDDFGTQNATPWAQEKLFQILNHRYVNELPTVITTNVPFEQIEGRIRSRLSHPELVRRVSISAPDYRRPYDEGKVHELSSLSLFREKTFGQFKMRKGEGLPTDEVKNLDKVFRTARDFAESPQGWLVLTGTYGSGKTHLAAAIANYQAGIAEEPPLFVVVPDLLDHLRATFNPSSAVSLDRRFEEVRTARLLILDDLGTQSATPWAREKLYQLFNYRYNAKLPTVITTTDSLEDMDPRIRSRMLDKSVCRVLAITVPTYRGK
ncbi:MAG: ATP-binding protein [Anaerolineales bacterium]|nr:ATP-binding protein [Anaerolineales bacterium]